METLDMYRYRLILGAPGFVNFNTAVAYHFCPSLPANFTQPVHILSRSLYLKETEGTANL